MVQLMPLPPRLLLH